MFRDETVYVVYPKVVYVKVVRESFIVRLEGSKSSLQLFSLHFSLFFVLWKKWSLQMPFHFILSLSLDF